MTTKTRQDMVRDTQYDIRATHAVHKRDQFLNERVRELCKTKQETTPLLKDALHALNEEQKKDKAALLATLEEVLELVNDEQDDEETKLRNVRRTAKAAIAAVKGKKQYSVAQEKIEQALGMLTK